MGVYEIHVGPYRCVPTKKKILLKKVARKSSENIGKLCSNILPGVVACFSETSARVSETEFSARGDLK